MDHSNPPVPSHRLSAADSFFAGGDTPKPSNRSRRFSRFSLSSSTTRAGGVQSHKGPSRSASAPVNLTGTHEKGVATSMAAAAAIVVDQVEATPFFAGAARMQQSEALLLAARELSLTEVQDALELGAPADARDGDTLAHTFVLARNELWTSATAVAQSEEAMHGLLSRHFHFDPSSRELLRRPGRVAALGRVVRRLANSKWRCPRSSGSVLHAILTTIEQLDLPVALHLCQSALSTPSANDDRQLRDSSGRTPHAIAAVLPAKYARVQALFVEILFGRFRLDCPTPLYRSQTSVIYSCTDLASTDSKSTSNSSLSSASLLIKLCKSERHWRREWRTRVVLGDNAKDAVVPFVATCAVQSKLTSTHIPADCCLIDEPFDASPSAQTLMLAQPFGLVLPAADLSLFEAASKYELARSPLAELRCIAHQIAGCVAALHNCDVVHGDLKPRNIVRSGRAWMLIDLDMAVRLKSGATTQIDLAKLDGSSAYVPPELFISARTARRADNKTLHQDANAPQRDIWGFGATLFELVSGRPLISNTYDTVDERGETQFLKWGGLEEADKRLVQRHGEEATVAVLDLLDWCLAPDPRDRPQTMNELLRHAFFDAAGGSLREHVAVEEIKRLLRKSTSIRDPRTIMISYCWASKTFVLKLCRDLALRFGRIVLDRLGDMRDFVDASMQRMVSESDIIIAVVSKGYTRSTNCLKELEIARALHKRIVPINLEFDHAEWIGGGLDAAHDHFITKKGDTALYIDFRSVQQYQTKLVHELLPTLDRSDSGETAPAALANPGTLHTRTVAVQTTAADLPGIVVFDS